MPMIDGEKYPHYHDIGCHCDCEIEYEIYREPDDLTKRSLSFRSEPKFVGDIMAPLSRRRSHDK